MRILNISFYVSFYGLFATWTLAAQGGNQQSSLDTDLGFKIMGTIIEKEGKNNVALLKITESGKVQAVKEDFTILDQYRIVGITAKYIDLENKTGRILAYNSKFAKIFTPKTSVSSAAPSSSVYLGQDEVYTEEGFERRGNDIKIASTLRDKLIQEDLSKILMQAAAVPVIEDNQMKGFRFLEIEPGSLFDKSGILDGDIVYSINNRALVNAAETIRFLNTLRGESEIRLGIEREGVKFVKMVKVL